MKVYLVESGLWSDYGVEKIFATKDLAEAYAEQLKQEDEGLEGVDVSEEEVLESLPPRRKMTLSR